MKNKWTNLMNKYQFKIGLVAFASVLLGLLLMISVSQYGLLALSHNSSKEIKRGLDKVSVEYMNNYIGIAQDMVESKVQRFFDEQAMIADIYQKYLDHSKEFAPLVQNLVQSPFFKDNLWFSGNWYENTKDEPAVVLIQRYLLDKQNKIKPSVKAQVDQSAILDWFMPSVYKFGAKKLWVYFQGGEDASFMRITPWNDAGRSMDKIYPKFTDQENWEAFNPGLVGAWEKQVKLNSKDLSSLAIVKPPTQDGGTGKIIMTLDHPLWSADRKQFKGAICIDVELDEIISYIKNVKLGDTGFAFISQSNGNVFAINEGGAETLGLKSVKDATVKGTKGVGFNPMLRYFKDSNYESVRKIQLPGNGAASTGEININGKEYILVEKNLKPMNTWNRAEGIHKETWTLGFIVPKQEMYSTYFASMKSIGTTKSKIMYEQLFTALLTLLLVSLGIYLVTKRMTQSLKKLEIAATDIMNKNYEVSVDIESEDEIGKLGATINNMVGELKATIYKLSVQNELLKNEIAEKQDKERKIRYLEDYDTLTNLPNQNLLITRLNEIINNRNKNTSFVLAIIGIDNFRNVNEVFGHSGGNEILKLAAARLKGFVASNGMVSRINGDEFAIIFDDVNTTEEAVLTIEVLMNKIKHVYNVDSRDVYITACAGISSYPTDGENPDDLIQFASSALVHAKENGPGSYRFYDAEMNKNAENRIAMISELKNAIKNNELELFYQPKFELLSKKCVGVEALLRWNSPVLGRVSPVVFIPLAEDTGMISVIGEWVLKTACLQMKKWLEMGIKGLTMAVNLSPVQFNKENLIQVIVDILDETKLSPEYLELEVTEGLFINDLNNAVKKLNELRELGIKIAVDDFGTGYSSLSYLRNLPIDKLKIDRSFIKDIPHSDEGSIANIIIDLAKNLNIRVNAEGVETADQEQFLALRMCDEVQGFYYSVPLSAGAITEKLVKGF